MTHMGRRGMSVLLPVVLTLLLVCPWHHCANAQLTPGDIQSMFDTTGIIPYPFCSPTTNTYTLQISNALPYAITALITLDCTVCANFTVPVNMDPNSISATISVTSPNSCQVANRLCTLVLTVPDMFSTVTPPPYVQVSAVPSTCGTVLPDDYTPNCDWTNYACQVKNGEWYHYGPFLATLSAALFIALVFIVFTVCMVYERTRQIKFRAVDFSRLSSKGGGQYSMTFGEGAAVNFYTGTELPLVDRPAGFLRMQGAGAAGGQRRSTGGSSASRPVRIPMSPMGASASASGRVAAGASAAGASGVRQRVVSTGGGGGSEV